MSLQPTSTGKNVILWPSVITVLSAAILIGAEVFGAAFAGGWALKTHFLLSRGPVTSQSQAPDAGISPPFASTISSSEFGGVTLVNISITGAPAAIARARPPGTPSSR